MPILKRHSRMISIRLTEDEYAKLTQRARDEGARSVSDMARQLLTSPSTATASIALRINNLERIIKYNLDIVLLL